MGVLGLVLIGSLVSGCAGASALRSSRQHYNEAIHTTSSEQLLLNIVRLQYRDPPTFMELSSLSTQFAIDGSASVKGDLHEGPANDILFLGGSAGFSERPTVTYGPISGQEFVKRLISPIELETILLLTRSGWSAARVLRMTVQNLNGLENARSASGPTPSYKPRFEDFLVLVKSLRELQIRGDVEAGYYSITQDLSDPVSPDKLTAADVVDAAREEWKWEKRDQEYVLTSSTTELAIALPRSVQSEEEARAMLGLRDDVQLDPDLRKKARDGERFELPLDIEPRSLLGTLYYLSQGVHVPPEHRAQGLVVTTRDDLGCPFDWNQVVGDLFRVCYQRKKPRDAAVAVRYRDYWFYIDDRDLQSKATFALLMELFELRAGGVATGTAPVLTLPIGG
jgi:hypothetical protein